jgi:hypothetical protein
MKVIKNVLSKKESNMLLKNTIFNNNFPWYYLHDSSTLKEKSNTFNYSWYHALVFNGQINSSFYSIFEKPILNIINRFIKYNVLDLIC